MSVVANAVSSYGSWVGYDGLAKKNGETVSEDQEKALMINKYVCVGFTGVLEVALIVVQNLKSHVVGIDNMRSNIVASAVELILSKIGVPQEYNATFIITGVNSGGRMATYVLGTGNRLNSYIPHGEDLKTVVLCSERNKLNLEPYIVAELKHSGFSSSSIVMGIKNYIADVSKIDPSVNANARIIEIQK